MENSTEIKKAGMNITLNIPFKFKDKIPQFQYMVSKDKRIPDGSSQNSTRKMSIAIRFLIAKYLNENWDELFIEEEFEKYQEYQKQMCEQVKVARQKHHKKKKHTETWKEYLSRAYPDQSKKKSREQEKEDQT